MLDTLTKLDPQSFMGAFVRLPLRLIPRDHVTVVRRGINKGFRWVVGSSIHGCWLGTYEHKKQTLMSRLLRPGMVVWDVGANAGFYSLAFSRLVGDAGKVYAFEPFAENTTNLLTHLRLNNIKNTQIVQAALAETTGLSGFSVAASNSMGHLSQQVSSYLVPSIAVDDFLARCPEARPDLFKIDIEGAESSLLLGGFSPAAPLCTRNCTGAAWREPESALRRAPALIWVFDLLCGWIIGRLNATEK